MPYVPTPYGCAIPVPCSCAIWTLPCLVQTLGARVSLAGTAPWGHADTGGLPGLGALSPHVPPLTAPAGTGAAVAVGSALLALPFPARVRLLPAGGQKPRVEGTQSVSPSSTWGQADMGQADMGQAGVGQHLPQRCTQKTRCRVVRAYLPLPQAPLSPPRGTTAGGGPGVTAPSPAAPAPSPPSPASSLHECRGSAGGRPEWCCPGDPAPLEPAPAPALAPCPPPPGTPGTPGLCSAPGAFDPLATKQEFPPPPDIHAPGRRGSSVPAPRSVCAAARP